MPCRTVHSQNSRTLYMTQYLKAFAHLVERHGTFSFFRSSLCGEQDGRVLLQRRQRYTKNMNAGLRLFQSPTLFLCCHGDGASQQRQLKNPVRGHLTISIDATAGSVPSPSMHCSPTLRPRRLHGSVDPSWLCRSINPSVSVQVYSGASGWLVPSWDR